MDTVVYIVGHKEREKKRQFVIDYTISSWKVKYLKD